MVHFKIIEDKIVGVEETDYLGVHFDNIKSGQVETLPDDFDGWFPFMPLCFSLGDIAIRTGIYKALKTKYPKIKIAFPKTETIEKICDSHPYFKHIWENDFTLNDKINPTENIKTIMSNNPYIDYYFDIGDFTHIFTDHDRAYTSLQNINGQVYSAEEPLAEQVLRRFGFTDEDIKNIDSKPTLHFTDEEIDKGNETIKKYVGDKEYGCLLFSSRRKELNHRWSEEEYLYEDAERFKGLPVFFYSSYDLNNTEWDNYFTERFNFGDLDLSIREQLYIKSKAKFNIGYQAGITDACASSDSEIITLCIQDTIRENIIKNVKYRFKNGRKIND